MNKTIYLRDEDVPIWDRAKAIAGDTISQVIVAALKEYAIRKEGEAACAKGYERIEVAFWDADANGVPRRRAFYGKWVFDMKKPRTYSDEDGYTIYNNALALTAKGNVVVLTWVEDPSGERQERHKFYVFPSLEAAAKNADTNIVAVAAMVQIGVPIEELDI